MGAMTVGPFWATKLGAAKQFALMNWCAPRPDLGLQVMSGLSCPEGGGPGKMLSKTQTTMNAFGSKPEPLTVNEYPSGPEV